MGTLQTHDKQLEDGLEPPTVDRFRRQFESFEDITEVARIESEIDRDYKDNKQWTQEEVDKLNARNQAAIVVNRVKPKVEGMKGLLIQRRTDPRAYPRTEKHQKAAEAITDALRFVSDNTDMDELELDVADNVFVEGYGAALIDVKRKEDEWEIDLQHIPWDRYYYDPHSRRKDFKDKRFDGIVVWLDLDVALELYPDADVEALMTTQGSTTFEDKPLWVDSQRKRVKVCQHFYLEKSVWMMCVFSTEFLVEPQESPYLDEEGKPMNPIEAVGSYIDRDLARFGEVRYWRDLQDEINHRRSKFLFLNSARQTMARKGAITDIPAFKREAAKADGHLEWVGEKGDFEIVPTSDMAKAQFDLLQHSEAQLDAISFNAQLSGERQGDLSGRAVDLLQQAGSLELSPIYSAISNWKLRVYRQVWARIKQFWDAEKWIRVTDDHRNLKWVGLNHPVTLGEKLQETIQDESLAPQVRQQAAQALQIMVQGQDPRLQQVQEVRNKVAELDVDIILEQSQNVINIQREQFELLANLASNRPEVPFKALLQLSELRDKDQLIADIEKSEQAGGQQQQELLQLQKAGQVVELQTKTQKAQVDNEKTQAETEKLKSQKDQTDLENLILLERPDTETQVII